MVTSPIWQRSMHVLDSNREVSREVSSGHVPEEAALVPLEGGNIAPSGIPDEFYLISIPVQGVFLRESFQ